MKNSLLLCLIMVAPLVYGNKLNETDPLAVYTGKYQVKLGAKMAYIQIYSKDEQLNLTELWSGDKYTLKHLSGDNFVMEYRGWAIKFNRDKRGAVISVLVMERDLWTRVK